jgi:trk system potassium uptake protein TrkH
MQFSVVQRILGLLIMVFSVTMLPPALVGFWYQDQSILPFIEGFLILLLSGFLVWFPVRTLRHELRLRDGFVIVVLFWAGLGVAGGVPLMLSDQPQISVTDAVFESISGLTTTGATVITGLDTLPKSILFYRQLLQWLGGMGIIVLAVAILPMLGVGGMQLYRAETPGPVKDSKLTPRITETAKALWIIYFTLTVACMLAYWLAGMGAFDALAHSFSTVAIGGFSTHDASIGYFNSPAIEGVAIFFMLISGVNFALHFFSWRALTFRSYWQDSELRTYFAGILATSFVVVLFLYFSNTTTSLLLAIRQGLFQTVSVATTTGFATTNFSLWPVFIPVLLLLASFVGGCAGSTGGGMKVIRVLLILKQGMREVKRLVHPNATFIIKVGKKPLPDNVIEAVWGFFSAYVFVFTLIMLVMLATGMDQVTAFSSVAASLNNLGPGLGDVATNYASIKDVEKWALCMAMLMGRLEIFTLLVIMSPAFWRR